MPLSKAPTQYDFASSHLPPSVGVWVELNFCFQSSKDIPLPYSGTYEAEHHPLCCVLAKFRKCL